MEFNLKRFKAGHAAITREGRLAHFLFFDEELAPGLVLGVRVDDLVYTYFADGRYLGDGEIHYADLVELTPGAAMAWFRPYRTPSGTIECAIAFDRNSKQFELNIDWVSEPQYASYFPSDE